MLKRMPVPFWILLSAGLFLFAAVLSFPSAFGFSRTEQIVSIESGDGLMLSADLPQGIKSQRKREFLFPDSLILYENGISLRRPISPENEISNAGRGRYQFSGSKVHFSTSDGGPIAGRAYTIRSPLWSLRESLLLAVWLVGLAVAAITARLAVPCGAACLMQRHDVAFVSLALSSVLVTVFFCFRSALSDQFFRGLLFPVVWAVLMGANALQKHVAGRVGLMVLALLPALAGYFYYGVNAASDGSFLVAGIIPCSDAWVYFVQSAEIALQGTTQQIFNGRFLYPVFFAVLLKLSGLNIFIANLLVSSLVMLALAFTCQLVAKRAGGVGAAIYCLLFWLYFRVHGCGLLMSENLGLLMGVLGLGFLFFSVDGKKIWLVFAALVFFGLGMAARPGALFILPALALYAGIRVWNLKTGRLRAVAAVGSVFLGLVLTAGCFGSNQLLMKTLSHGERKAFGNFAFTLHGLLNDTKWSTSADVTGWNASLAMEQSIRQIKESPGSLIHGVGRAYGEMLKKRFLFRFGSEKRLASAGMALFFLASLTCWLWKPLRADSMWIPLLFAGILASVPFAPPWDAGERPYAATVPVQIFLAAAGFAMLLDLLNRLAKILVPDDPADFCKQEEIAAGGAFQRKTGLICFAALCLFLVFPAPLLLKASANSRPFRSPTFLPGSSLLISKEGLTSPGCLSRADYLDRLSDFQASHPDNARFYTSEPADFLLAINWSNLETVLLPWPLPGPLPVRNKAP